MSRRNRRRGALGRGGALRRWARAAAAIVVLFGLVAAPRPAAARSFYRDVPPTYWAAGEIYDLWTVGVTDGWTIGSGFNWWEAFRPTTEMTRAEFAILLAKAFRLAPDPGPSPFSDVPDTYVAYDDVRVVPWLRAAQRAGTLDGEGPRFRPEAPVTREAAVAWLVRALELDPYAQSLSPADVGAILGRFRDHGQVTPTLAAELAAAVALDILRGYPDGTLRPAQALLRGEAAALVHRSAWVRAEADPAAITPDGDGHADATELVGHALQNGNIRGWRLWIEDAAGKTVRTFYGARSVRSPQYAETWDGRDDRGFAVPPGLYFVRAAIESDGALFRYSTPYPVRVANVWLTASLEPAEAAPKARVVVRAATSLLATGVAYETPWGGGQLAPGAPAGGSRPWSASFTPPASAAAGTYPVLVSATFEDGARRTARLTLKLTPPAPPDEGDDAGLDLGDVVIVLTGP